MILDIMENLNRYRSLNTGFVKALEFLIRPDLKSLPVGKYEIDGDTVYATVARDTGRKKENAQLETHDRYIDVQVILEGIDDMGWKARSLCRTLYKKYDQNADIQFFADEPDAWMPIKPGMFVVFFPEDAHMPMISSGLIHKVVVKIAINPR